MKGTLKQFLPLLLIAGARNAQAHHAEVMGLSLSHAFMSVPATIATAIGALLFFGWGLKRRKNMGAGFVLVSLPLWLVAFDIIG